MSVGSLFVTSGSNKGHYLFLRRPEGPKVSAAVLELYVVGPEWTILCRFPELLSRFIVLPEAHGTDLKRSALWQRVAAATRALMHFRRSILKRSILESAALNQHRCQLAEF